MPKILRQNIGGVDYTMAGCALTANCTTSASDYVKDVVLSDGDVLSDGMTVVVNFENGNTAGTAPASLTIYSSDQTNYYSDPELTQPFTLAPQGCYTIEYTGTGNAYSYISYPVVQIGNVQGALCYADGSFAGGTLWNAGDLVSILYTNGRYIIPDSAVDAVQSDNMKPVTSNAVNSALGVMWQGQVNTITSNISDVFNYCKTKFKPSRVCSFRLNPNGSYAPFGTSSVTIIYCLSSVNYGWIMGLSDKADCNSAIAYVNEGSVSPWQKLINSTDLGQQYNDSNAVDISSQVTMSLGITAVRARRFNNMVYLSFSGDYTGQPSNATQILISGLPQKYRPSFEVVGLCALGYSSNFSSVGRVMIAADGNVLLQETEWPNNTAIRAGIIYFI